MDPETAPACVVFTTIAHCESASDGTPFRDLPVRMWALELVLARIAPGESVYDENHPWARTSPESNARNPCHQGLFVISGSLSGRVIS